MPDDAAHNRSEDAAPGKIAVLGGSGFIGTHLTLFLLQMGYRLRLLHHRTDPDYVSPRGQIESVPGSIDDQESLERCFAGCSRVYHLVGIIAETRTNTFQRTVAEGTRRVVDAARKAGVKKIFYLSALGASDDAEIAYFRTKWEAEQAVRESGLGYTIFRPSIVYGVRDEFINKIASMVKYLPVVPVIGDGRYRFQPVYVEELAAIMAHASRLDRTNGKIYEVGGPEQLTYMEILDIIKRVLGRKRLTVHIPISWVMMAAAVTEKVLKPAPLTRDQIRMLEKESVCDNTVVEKEFGVTFSRFELQLQKYLGKR
jgi:uncharacterized protein YbjT (DUF2867 family)